jgi:hypothetical protein
LRADRQAAAPAPAKKDIAADRNARTRGVAAAAVVADAAPSALIARAWNEFQPVAPGGDKVAKTDVSKADVSKADVSKADVRAKTAPLAAGQMRLASVESRPVPQRPAAPEGLSVPAARPALLEGPPPQTRLAALDSPPVQVGRPRAAPEELLPRLPTNTEEKTELVGFDTSPFPYNGESGRHHTVFRGRTASETDTYGTYSDPRVLLHIPQGFDPSRPAVMVVFFHGHRASLAQDVRDRQKVPAQITASGSNAVLVAPQFAVNAADSNAGKFYEQGGFRRFLDESAKQLARLHGDPRSAQAFANMPIVIVAYSGGYGPLLSVLSRGEVKPSRIHGIVMLDALYSGMDRFAEWIANNRSAFYISSYTPHTRGRNVELEDMLAARSVPYGSELRREHLQGMVTFLPAGAISHRDFVNHAWGDYPIADVLMRMDELDHNLEVAHKPTPPAATASVAPRD